jgi:hypothetical protein
MVVGHHYLLRYFRLHMLIFMNVCVVINAAMIC